MEMLEMQLNAISKVFADNHPMYKVFKCPSGLYNTLLNLDSIENIPIVLKSDESSLKGHIALNDTNLNVVDVRNISDIERFIGMAKNWIYHGKETTGRIAFPTESFETRYFSNDLKLASYELDMDNQYLLERVLGSNGA